MDLDRGPATPAVGGRPTAVRISEFSIRRTYSAHSAVHRCRAGSVGRCRTRILFRKRTPQRAVRIPPLPPERDARVTAPSRWMLAAPPMTQAVWTSKTAFSGRSASTAVEDVASYPNRLSRCALRSDDTDARKSIVRRFGRSDRSGQECLGFAHPARLGIRLPESRTSIAPRQAEHAAASPPRRP